MQGPWKSGDICARISYIQFRHLLSHGGSDREIRDPPEGSYWVISLGPIEDLLGRASDRFGLELVVPVIFCKSLGH